MELLKEVAPGISRVGYLRGNQQSDQCPVHQGDAGGGDRTEIEGSRPPGERAKRPRGNIRPVQQQTRGRVVGSRRAALHGQCNPDHQTSRRWPGAGAKKAPSRPTCPSSGQQSSIWSSTSIVESSSQKPAAFLQGRADTFPPLAQSMRRSDNSCASWAGHRAARPVARARGRGTAASTSSQVSVPEGVDVLLKLSLSRRPRSRGPRGTLYQPTILQVPSGWRQAVP